MKKIKTHTPKAKTALRRYARTQILAHPEIVRKLRPTVPRPTLRCPSVFGK